MIIYNWIVLNGYLCAKAIRRILRYENEVADGYQRIYEDVKIEQTEDKKQKKSNIEEVLIVVSMLGATGTIKFSKKR